MKNNIHILCQKLAIPLAQPQLRQTDIPLDDLNFLKTRRIFFSNAIKNGILQQLLQPLLGRHAAFGAQQNLHRFDAAAGAQQLLQQRFPQETGGAGDENRRAIVEVPNVGGVGALLMVVVDDRVVVDVRWEDPKVLVGVDTHCFFVVV